MKSILPYCLLLAALPLSAAWNDPSGRPYTAIVIPADAPGSVRLAADDLARCLAAAGCAELPVVVEPAEVALPAVWIGATAAARNCGVETGDFAADEFLWRTVDAGLLIVGDDHAGEPPTAFLHPWGVQQVYNRELDLSAFGSAGSMQGVYRFLMEFAGVRWFWPGPDGEVIPSLAELRTPELDQRRKPCFEQRFQYFCDFADSAEDALWFKRLGNGGRAPLSINHSFPTLVRFQPPESEFFALVDGGRDSVKRLCAVTGVGGLCLNNPELLDHTVRMIRGYFDGDPGHLIFPLVPDDGLTRICECPACQADLDPDKPYTGRFSRHVWGFVCRVAKEIAVSHPDRLIGSLAYERYLDPPEGVEFPPNVVVQLCQSRRNFVIPEYREAVLRSREHWRAKLGPGRSYIWEYYLDANPPWQGFPVLYAPEIAADLRLLHETGGGGEMIEAESWFGEPTETPRRLLQPATQHLNLYLTARCYWEPQLDLDAVLDEYYRLAYGPAEAEMRQFWELAQQRFRAGLREAAAEYDYDPTMPSKIPPNAVYTADLMRELLELLRQARAATAEGTPCRRRVETLTAEFEAANRLYARLTRIDNPTLKVTPQPGLPERLVTRDGGRLEPPSWFITSYDADNLYVKLINYEPEMNSLKALTTGFDDPAAWSDDCVEIFIAPDAANREHCFQLIVSASGALFDAEFSVEYPYGHAAWNSGATGRVVREPNRWIAEAAIPWNTLGIAPAPGGGFAMNLYRVRRAGGGGYGCWSPITGAAHYAPAHFGAVRFTAGNAP